VGKGEVSEPFESGTVSSGWLEELSLAGRVGISPSEWENMTPAAFNAYVRGYLKEQDAQQEIAAAQNYRLAVMVRSAVWGKRMPPYETFAPKRSKRSMTDDEMYQSVLALNAALGGKTEGG